MVVLNPISRDTIKHLFIDNDTKGKVIKAEILDMENVRRKLVDYVSQFEVGPYTMHQRFTPGFYLWLWISIGEFVVVPFILSCNEYHGLRPEFFLHSEVQLKFEDKSGFAVW